MTKTTDEARDRWDGRYRTEGFVFGTAPNQFVAEHLADAAPGRALDLGCGQGRNAVWLALQGHDVTAVDLSPVAIEQARELAAEAGTHVDFVAADLATWDRGPDPYDLVLLSYLQLAPEMRSIVHANAVAALAPGGSVFLIAHHLDNVTQGVGGPPYPEVNYTEEQLVTDFGSLTIDHVGRVERTVEKPGVSGTAIDVMLIARR